MEIIYHYFDSHSSVTAAAIHLGYCLLIASLPEKINGLAVF